MKAQRSLLRLRSRYHGLPHEMQEGSVQKTPLLTAEVTRHCVYAMMCYSLDSSVLPILAEYHLPIMYSESLSWVTLLMAEILHHLGCKKACKLNFGYSLYELAHDFSYQDDYPTRTWDTTMPGPLPTTRRREEAAPLLWPDSICMDQSWFE